MTEPAHFLGMYHLLAKTGHQVELLVQPSREELADTAQRIGPDFVGFSSYRQHSCSQISSPQQWSSCDSLQEYAQLIGAWKAAGIKIGIGGWGATTNPGHFARTYRPDFIVKGPGERPLLTMAESGFVAKGIETEDIHRGYIDDTAILQVPDGEKWIEVSFERPYPLARY
ncbi:MAG TPA: hypothetical protein VMT55_04875, partial [Candidatus Sulfotelmatobacter sp.]|nr:hypothetical protein [Candidatus Sulfotelmatobacter sp.]